LNPIYQNPFDDRGIGTDVHVIRDYLPVLQKYARNSSVVVEFGVRTAISTYALLAAAHDPYKLVSVDVAEQPVHNFQRLQQLTEECGIDWTFVKSSDLDVKLDHVDMLFIDSEHTFEHVQALLRLHASSVRKYIVLHDTSWDRPPQRRLWSHINEKYPGNPVWSAVKQFLESAEGKMHWRVLERRR
jgi:cephalosporin hydroxylase